MTNMHFGDYFEKNVDPNDLVLEFHRAFGAPVGQKIEFLDPAREKLRFDLIKEELRELTDAVAEWDMIETADALGDLVYVVYGFAIEMGINLGPVLLEIHDSNMSKLDANGDPILREDGKILKSHLFREPNIGKVLYGDNAQA